MHGNRKLDRTCAEYGVIRENNPPGCGPRRLTERNIYIGKNPQIFSEEKIFCEVFLYDKIIHLLH